MSDLTNDLCARLRAAGVVGAGGAGFPAYVKAGGRAEFVIVNAAECEPLLKKDRTLLELFPEKIADGLELFMRSTGAARGVIGIKKKHEALVKRLEKLAAGRPNLSVRRLGDYYPAGDEQCLVYEATGRVTPMGGIPLDSGCVVLNVETLYNAARVSEGPVTEKYLTVAGAVRKPCTVRVPVGLSFGEAIAIAGGAAVREFAVIDGGPMMGSVTTDLGAPVTKCTGGLIVLPKDHPLIARKAAGRPAFSRIGRSACDQCSFCTELCPRYLLGHGVQPHRAMRSLLFSGAGGKLHAEYALPCCECGLCTLYSCPEKLSPREVCAAAKADLRAMKIGLKNSALAGAPAARVHPLREERKVPVSRLVRRLGLQEYDNPAPYYEHGYEPAAVRIRLSQHAGVPCAPTVTAGRKVKKGEIVGAPPADKLGCPVHASIAGTVSAVNAVYVEIKAL